MAGVTDGVFRRICKDLGADAMVTEFVSAEGIIQADERTRIYTEFDETQRPIGIQLFGADGKRMAEAAGRIIDWKRPEFIDVNFGCPVKKVVSKNGGSSLLKDCPALGKVAGELVKGIGNRVPVTAKIRIGWDFNSINATEVCHILEDAGVEAIAVHGRTRSQGYRGEADWDVIDACAKAVAIPVIGNGDISSGADVEKRRKTTSVSGVMIGRAAMQHPWVFQEAKQYLEKGRTATSIHPIEKWNLILRHARMLVRSGRFSAEKLAIQYFRSRLMAYSRGLPRGKALRVKFSTVGSLTQLEGIAETHLEELASYSSLS